MNSRRAGFAKLLQVLAPIWAFILIAGCASSSSHSATKAAKSNSKPHATTKVDLAATSKAPSFQGRAVLTQTATGKSPCEKSSPTPASPGEVGGGNGGSA